MNSDPSFLDIAADLRKTVDEALPGLKAISEEQAGRPLGAEKWSSKEIVGHLIDSAANNHQRFVRAQEGSALVFPGYAQDHWVDCQGYRDRAWSDLTSFWHAYNTHLVHVIGLIPEARRTVPCTVKLEQDAPVTLGFLVADYVVHLRHHLAQLKALKESPRL